MIPLILLAAVVVALLLDRHFSEARTTRERSILVREFAVERSELLLRIQHPQVVVPPRAPEPEALAPKPDPDDHELAKVGTIVFSPEDADLAAA